METPDKILYASPFDACTSNTMDVTKEPVRMYATVADIPEELREIVAMEDGVGWGQSPSEHYSYVELGVAPAKLHFRHDLVEHANRQFHKNEYNEALLTIKEAAQQSMVETSEELGLYGTPESQEWVDGVPNVGVTCLALSKGQQMKGEVLAAHDDVLWMRFTYGYETINADKCNFKPIKSQAEQKAEEERDRFIVDAQKQCTDFGSNQIGKIYDWLKSTGQLSQGKE